MQVYLRTVEDLVMDPIPSTAQSSRQTLKLILKILHLIFYQVVERIQSSQEETEQLQQRKECLCCVESEECKPQGKFQSNVKDKGKELELRTTSAQNPTQFLFGETLEEFTHNCAEVIELQTKIRPDFEEEELEGEKWFVDGSARMVEGKRKSGYAIVDGKTSILELDSPEWYLLFQKGVRGRLDENADVLDIECRRTNKSDGEWRLTVDYCALNEVTPPLSAAVPDMLELQYALESKAARWYATIDIANAIFSIPLAAECRPQFAFT
ncbi:hypothetical protein HGM15179_020882 [Zosterops borbonicus]|uniref:Uncharacterized protein n=1 Tax=Zosterops borbonicus TaxID=364589 RepID=A0A8K1D5I8_9PASS|nr:hypothetical protein HGM15179_020882 [Zosterops borbonicus]